jgi:hypothetical protein
MNAISNVSNSIHQQSVEKRRTTMDSQTRTYTVECLVQTSFAEIEKSGTFDWHLLPMVQENVNLRGEKCVDRNAARKQRNRIIREALDRAEDAYYDRLAEERDTNREQFCEDVDWVMMYG